MSCGPPLTGASTTRSPRCGDRLGGARASRGVDDEDGIRRHGGDEVALQADLPDLLVGEHADDDGVGALGDARPDPSPAVRPIPLQLARFSGVRPSARTSWPASTSRRTIGAPMRPAPTKPTRVIAGVPSRSARRRPHRTPRPAVPTRRRRGSRHAGRPSAATPLRSAPVWSRVPPKAAMLPSALLVADPRVSTSHSLSRRNAKGLAQFQGADRAAQVGGEQQVVQDLGDLAAAERAQVHDRVGVGREHRAAALDDLVVAADHDQQLALLDGGRPAAHRGVDDRNTLCGSRLASSRQVSGCTVLWMATIPPGASPASTPVSPLSTSLTSSSPTTHRQTRSLAAASSAGEPRGLRGGVGERFQGGRPARPQRQVVTALDDPPRHRAALAAQSDESDAHQPASTSRSSCPVRQHIRSTNDSTRRW